MNTPKISLIAAISENRALGKDNKLLFRIGEDMKRFKRLTGGHVVIMGRKTFESIGKFLPNRMNIIVTRDQTFDPHKFCSSENCEVFVVHSLEEAIKVGQEKANQVYSSSEVPPKVDESRSFLKGKPALSSKGSRQARTIKNITKQGEIFIIGGGQIYSEALKYADKLYLTVVEGEYEADTFFPEYSAFKKVVFKKEGTSYPYKYTFLELER